MTIQAALGTYLRAYSDLTDLLGQRLYPVHVPENDPLPYAAYRVENVEPDENTLEGVYGLETFTLRVECCSRDYDEAWRIARAIRTALTGFSGAMGDVQRVNIAFQTAGDGEAAEFGIFVVTVEFFVSYPAE